MDINPRLLSFVIFLLSLWRFRIPFWHDIYDHDDLLRTGQSVSRLVREPEPAPSPHIANHEACWALAEEERSSRCRISIAAQFTLRELRRIPFRTSNSFNQRVRQPFARASTALRLGQAPTFLHILLPTGRSQGRRQFTLQIEAYLLVLFYIPYPDAPLSRLR